MKSPLRERDKGGVASPIAAAVLALAHYAGYHPENAFSGSSHFPWP
jgi:hypothetical protein